MFDRLLKGYRTAIFDFDGTIADLTVDWNALRKEIRCHFPESLEDLNLHTMVSLLVDRHGEPARDSLAKIIASYEQPFGRARFCPISVTVRAIQSLKHYYVISNNLHSTVKQVIEELGLMRSCSGIVGFDDTLRSKPSVEPFQILAGRCNLPRPIVYIGDHDSDREFALNAMIDFIHVQEL